jgi:GTP-binding protein EngB required for normal cell division
VSSRVPVLNGIDRLLSLPDGLLPKSVLDDVGAVRERLVEHRCNVAVIGEFNRGKSPLVNALVGAEVVPTGVLPLTSAVTILRHGGAARLLVRFLDGREEEHVPEHLRRYATEAENPGNKLGVELTVVETPSPLLEGGLQIIDTPGIGSVHHHNTHAAQTFLPRIDAAVVVLSADQPLSTAERGLLATVDGIAGATIVVANRIDRLPGGDRLRVMGFLDDTLAVTAQAREGVIAVSATEGTGVDELRLAIARLVDGDGVTMCAGRRAVLRAAAAARSAAALEVQALDLPHDQMARRVEQFRAQVNALAPAREAATAALERSVAQCLRERMTDPLRRLTDESAAVIAEDLERCAESSRGMSTRALKHELDEWVDDRVRGCIDEVARDLEETMLAELGRVADRYAAHVDEILARVSADVFDAFGEHISWEVSPIGFAEARPFQYKLRDEGEGLGDAVSLARSLVPGAAGRRLVVREARVRLVGLIDRHAGRLREQLTERTLTAIRTYHGGPEATVDDATARVWTAVDRGRRELDHGAERAASRRAALADAIALCERIGCSGA